MANPTRWLKVRPMVMAQPKKSKPAIEFIRYEQRDDGLYQRSRIVLLASDLSGEFQGGVLIAVVDALMADSLYKATEYDEVSFRYSFADAILDLLPRLDRNTLQQSFWQHAI